MTIDPFADDLAAVARIDIVPMILDVVCRATGMGFSAIARVTEDRWIACAVRDEINFGLEPGGELDVRTTICNEIRQSGQLVAIDHVSQDNIFHDHPTPKLYGFQSYISVPISSPDGRFFGTLCAIDPRPIKLNRPETVGMFKLLAELIGFHLDTQDRIAACEAALATAQRATDLREQVIAVLGHDLRNPLASVDAGVRTLLRTPLDANATAVLGLMRKSVVRMAGLVDNVLDFARGQIGGGIRLDCTLNTELAAILGDVIAELRAVWPDRVIIDDVALDHPVRCDSGRIQQLLSNLVANALAHGDPNGPVRVDARTDSGNFELSVVNHGAAIPADSTKRLFKAFARGTGRSSGEGLGLGLYIASEIARAHAGALHLVSTEEQTRFTFRMALTGPPEAVD